ncbi:Ark- serine/threonine protein kinase [Conoideocrella luteorostrata]|uniref:Ark- serine/threonine protein kinase n=1 Tax=Conoideocrella luteorostrata TaxID=1105319 RepID=A0AAJ0CD49_9HYPO|nr:Ark- serine/threonine protein kinase [Conoideocrella luteorostrata]
MLRENMQSRPNIYQVIKEACDMQGREVPIHDIYSGQAQRESHTISKSSPTKAQEPRQGAIVGAVYAPPAEEKPNLPDIVPMRRGRPAASPGPKKQAPSASKVTDGDPFAALDSTSSRKVAEADELSSRFPTLDQFSLLHDKGAKFNFEASAASPQFQSTPTNQDLAERLADEVFASSLVGSERPTPSPRPNSVTPTMQQGQHDPSPPAERPLSKIPSAPAKAEHTQPTPTSSTVRNSHDLKTISSKPGSKYVSTGTMTSDFSSKASPPRADVRHGESLPQRNSFKASPDVLPIHARPPHLRRPSLSSRPSLEDNRRQAQVSDPALASNVHNVRPRPASTSFESSTLDFLREKELARPQKTSTPPMSQTSQRPQNPRSQLRVESKTSRAQVEDDMLIDIVDSGLMAQSKQVDLSKRMTVSTAPVPKKLPKRLGDAVSRFEGASRQDITDVTRPKQPQQDVTPSDPAPGYNSNPASDPSTNTLIDIDEDTKTPEMRRELERQKLEEEEKRVAAAQAEYRNRITSSGKPVPGPKNVSGPPRTASTIQNRMQSLLNEEQKPTVVHRTAQGYGKYTDDPSTAPTQKVLPSIPRKPIGTKSRVDVPSNGTGSSTSTAPTVTSSYSAPVSAPKPIGPKPPAPKKKPTHLNSFPTGARPPSPIKQAWRAQPEYLVAVDLPGQPALEMSSQEKADYIEDFTKRFPSLSSIETDTQASRASGGSRQW